MLAILKSFVWILNRQSMQSFISFLLHDYWKLITERHSSKAIHKYATYGSNVTKGYLFLICIALLFFFTLPTIEMLVYKLNDSSNANNKHFPFTALYPPTFYESPMYEITYISQMLATSVCGLMILGTDTLIASALYHTCGHLEVLQHDCESLEISSEIQSQMAGKLHNKEINKRLTYIIKHHQLILWSCDIMENIFSPIMFLQVLASSLIICLVGFQVSSTLTKKYKLIEYISYLLMALFQLLLFSLPGDELIQQSSMISKVVYSMLWYELPMDARSNAQMIILRSQKPSYITAGKFCIINLENFSTVLSTSLSYFMLLRSINLEVENE